MYVRGFVLCFILLNAVFVSGQSFELTDRTESYTAGLSQKLQIPIKIRNTSDKPVFYIIRLADSELSSTQKGYFCLNDNCLEPGVTEASKKVEAGAMLEDLYFTLETGLVTGNYPIKFEIFARGNIGSLKDRSVNVSIEEKQSKVFVFQSKDITLHDVYPNPVYDQAFIDYTLHNEVVKAKIIVHNILGSSVSDHELPATESKVKIQADEMTPGVYFYTLYLDNIGVVTRKLIVRR